MPMAYSHILEFSILANGSKKYQLTATYRDPYVGTRRTLVSNLLFDDTIVEQWRQRTLDPINAGRYLRDRLLQGEVRDLVLQAMAASNARGGTLRFRLGFAPSLANLQCIPWEMMLHPEQDRPLAMDGKVAFSRYIFGSNGHIRGVAVPRSVRRAVVVIAHPSNLHEFGLTPFDAQGVLGELLLSLGDIESTVICPGMGDTLDHLDRALYSDPDRGFRGSPELLVLIAHGAMKHGESVLYLERADGTTRPVKGAEFVDHLAQLQDLPSLIVLGACQTAGDQYASPPETLGHALTEIGAPAVIALTFRQC